VRKRFTGCPNAFPSYATKALPATYAKTRVNTVDAGKSSILKANLRLNGFLVTQALTIFLRHTAFKTWDMVAV
jgi:hypothetical protein